MWVIKRTLSMSTKNIMLNWRVSRLKNLVYLDLCDKYIGPVKQNNLRKIAIVLLSISLNMCFGCSKEPSHWDGSFEYPQHMFWLRNTKNNFQLRTFIWRPVSTKISWADPNVFIRVAFDSVSVQADLGVFCLCIA